MMKSDEDVDGSEKKKKAHALHSLCNQGINIIHPSELNTQTTHTTLYRIGLYGAGYIDSPFFFFYYQDRTNTTLLLPFVSFIFFPRIPINQRERRNRFCLCAVAGLTLGRFFCLLCLSNVRKSSKMDL